MRIALNRSFATIKSAPVTTPLKSSQYVAPTPKEVATAERERWIEENQRFASDPTTRGPHFLGGRRNPFPLNPLFTPVSPLSHSTRQSVLELHTANTPLVEIAKSFGISVSRAHGIYLKVYIT